MAEDVFNELKVGLVKVTNNLNEKRGLWNKYILGQNFFLDEKNFGKDFRILTRYRNKKEGLYAEIKFDENGLDGFVIPDTKSAKPIINFLHSFSHQYNISMGYLASPLN